MARRKKKMVYVKRVDECALRQYANHLKNLTPEDKISRFGIQLTDYAIDQFILNVLYRHGHVLFQAIDESGFILGWGHMAKDNEYWELALSVEKDHQRKGIGDLLISEMLEWAKVNHISKIYMHCIEENKVIQHLAAKHKLKTKERSFGERTAAIDLPEPNWNEINNQLWKEYQSLIEEYTNIRKKIMNLWIKTHQSI